MNAARWTHGDGAIGRAVEALLATPAATEMRDSGARTLWRVRDGSLDVAVKRFRVGSGRHLWRERLKAAIGRAPALREWNALVAMRAAGIAAPVPLALGARPDGDRLLVMRWIDGRALDAALDAPDRDAPDRDALVATLGALLRQVHDAGFVHGDLHAGNCVVGGAGPVLLDWQHAKRTTSPSARLRDLARLDFALAPVLSPEQRVRLRTAALGDGASEDTLRAADVAARRRARQHARSRTRDACRPGRIASLVEADAARGLALVGLAHDQLPALLAAHRGSMDAGDANVIARSTRSRVSGQRWSDRAVVVKEEPWRGIARASASLLRGSMAARGWRGGHGLRARGIDAAQPLACLERRVLGLPVASWLVLEDLRPAPVAACAEALDATVVLDALAGLAIDLHRAGADHGDLKATHVFLEERAGCLVPRPIDLDRVRFGDEVPLERRVRALAQLNASLPDAFPADARCRAFARYAAALPFERDVAEVRREVVRASLARAHRWTGAGCADASALEATPAPPRATGSSSTKRGSCRRAPA